ncbi:unnamed protein product [Soboliphyme baturini]|uniref:Uncharacterized protein n=1 Tax=Soboliphyme baturini TaxID=241478 RepID=A0A183J6J5_9BILA|nr:unnamed protein product [Soboliphyme baturini]
MRLRLLLTVRADSPNDDFLNKMEDRVATNRFGVSNSYFIPSSLQAIYFVLHSLVSLLEISNDAIRLVELLLERIGVLLIFERMTTVTNGLQRNNAL